MENKEFSLKKSDSRLIKYVAGAILGAAALATTGCEYIAGYSYYEYSPFGSSYYSPYSRGIIIHPPAPHLRIHRQPRITPHRPFDNSHYRSPRFNPDRR
ncbi:MAG: hypothetical protein Q8N63_01020 [Nanoarchaeota archaeon]|nr:hypothetical protein [Nanoarchaeota archaeon]